MTPDGTVIRIEQVRELIGEIAFQPFEGKYRVAILDPADQMKAETSNSLLKTLEEPPSRSIIILVTTNPYQVAASDWLARKACSIISFHDAIAATGFSAIVC